MNELHVGPLRLRNRDEHERLRQMREEAFTPWVRDLPSRWLINAASRLYRGFFLEARRPDGKLAGFLFTAPTNWNGDPATLAGYEEAHRLLYQHLPKRFLPSFQRRFDTLVLLTMLIDPGDRGLHIPSTLIGAVRGRWKNIISPFRPGGYGAYKWEGRRAHSEELFREYCATGDDPWLRSLARNGMKQLRPEMRSVRVPRSLAYFEEFRRRFKPDRWYETAKGVWECGEVATWIIDGRRAWLIEPNVWGVL